jgi:hypothetical protein
MLASARVSIVAVRNHCAATGLVASLARPSGRERSYREFMEECLRWARTTRSEKHREALIEMAKTWSEAAVHLERRHGLVESRELLNVSEK